MTVLALVNVFRVEAAVVPYPVNEGFEAVIDTNKWTLTGNWALSAETAHGGTNSLTDSPGANYPNNVDNSARLKLDLQAASRPYLSFWQRYALEQGKDFGYVEVSKDEGNNWSSLFAVTGSGGTNWYNARIDLSPYAGDLVLVRFRIVTDAQNRYDGWYIDDVEVKNNGAVAGYPLTDNLDSDAAETNWLASAWKLVGGSSQSAGGKSWRFQMGDLGR
ncbi:MAG: choice-of-anchor J domain-containing protein, partial [Verrucomicrobiota bacterium]